MIKTELKNKVTQTGSYFFTRDTMRFFGDTMANYGVRSNNIKGLPVWELYRKKPVKHGLINSSYFSKADYSRVYNS